MELYEFDRRDGLVVRVVVDNAGAVRDLHRRLGGSQLPALALVSGGSL